MNKSRAWPQSSDTCLIEVCQKCNCRTTATVYDCLLLLRWAQHRIRRALNPTCFVLRFLKGPRMSVVSVSVSTDASPALSAAAAFAPRADVVRFF